MTSVTTASALIMLDESPEELYEHAPCGYLSALADGTIVRVNQTFLNWTGHSREAVIGKRLRDFLPLAGRVFYETHLDPLLRMQGFVREIALDIVCAGERLLPVLINSVQHRNAAGQVVITRTTIFDATERRTYERELLNVRRHLERFAAVVEASADAILVTSPEGRVESWNAGAERLFGYSADEAVGRPVDALIVPPDLVGQYGEFLELMRSGKQVQLETVRVHKDGRRLEVSLGLAPHIEAPGELTAISAIIRDITQRRLLEARLKQAEQLQAAATLAGGVAHEVNNQMAVVLGFGDFVLRTLDPEHPSGADVKAMVSAAGKAALLSRQLLAFSRQLPMVRQDVRLLNLVIQAGPALENILGPEITLAVRGSSQAVVSVDPDQIDQILIQLVTNARDAVPAGGGVTISVDDVDLADADAEAYPGDGVVPGLYVLLTVADTGTGMDRTTLAHAFQPFFTTKPFGQGTGLGLAMVHGVVKQHGGHVWATSQPGGGTTIRIYLPSKATASPAER
ncbi:MAG TPA: PAS domain S-box protein [Gemmatimonadales bacterium]